MKININGNDCDIRSIWFENGMVTMIDQNKLPISVDLVSFDDYHDIARAISNMTIRGAPSIGAAAAYAICIAALKNCDLKIAAEYIKATRPTANDLCYAIDYMIKKLDGGYDPISAADSYSQMIIDKCINIGIHGSKLIKNSMKIMTHCNAGSLATIDVGTGLAPIKKAWSQGKRFFVYVSETRPRLQGTKLTAWELEQDGIDYAVIIDDASAYYMAQGTDMIITGADRITSNGDFANKIGTLDKAIIAKHFGIPFYVAAPISTFDFSLKSGNDIIVEQRPKKEVTTIKGIDIAPKKFKALNPAFDITPSNLVTGFITEIGILRPNDIHLVNQ